MNENAQPLIIQGHYRLDQCLAQGSDSATFLAFNQETESSCIVKELRLGQLERWKRLELFRREARTLANLEHPQIPALLDYFEGEGDSQSVYLVTEKVPGIPLNQKIQEGLGLSEEFVYLIAVQVLQILSYLHHLHPPVVHRDLKPSNLLLDEAGCVYLIDFGGVQELLHPEGGGGSTIIGTFGYMAPEQYSGRSVPQTDLYGLGVTLIYLLSGLEPQQIPNPEMLLDFRPFVECSERFSNWIEQLILPSLEQRFFSADEALEVLQAILPVYTRTLSLPAIQKATSQAIDRQELKDRLPEKNSNEERLLPVQNWVLSVGEVLNDLYQIDKVLSTGSSSVTYRAHKLSVQTPVIVKELHFNRMEHWKGYELFEREMRILERMRHARTPRLLDFFEIQQAERHCFYLVTTLLPGMPLPQRLRSGWRPSENRLRQLADQMLDILIDLHEREPQIIHRDIKPSNILIDEQDHPALVDFGAVQEILREEGGGGSTIIGTYGYMAPEQFWGQATPQSDLYGLGVTLLHILSGRTPNEMQKAEGLGLDFKGYIQCSEGLQWWLSKMVAPQVSDRFHSAREARKKLAEIDTMRFERGVQAYFPFKPDPAIEVEDTPEKLVMHLMPTYHDYKTLMAVLLGVDLVGGMFFSAIPGLGPLLVISLLAASGIFVAIHRSEGLRTHMRIELSMQGLELRSWKDSQFGGTEPIENMTLPLQAIEAFSLDQTMVHNRLQVRIRHHPTDHPMLCKSRLPISHQQVKAKFLVQRLQVAVDQYQRQRKRLQERNPF
ncbi:hypothetical protein COW36_05350 [bacterium (Candidatus Blackallbacteria) CG17_big_fil_post_rev_8_21_14_2_50_48_46]|uniref:non-specific serine/threonine protein kinase n=1 Tax=bacterium (Candidatus Blackallbacteria) CG17_big_fil_post_rev_8_21_14_2_50_48_46 TaxID=2014261 RepID=A0A2M7G7X2_9BACT|nr:MAG: hypothetical protein COW64_20945 [bacterium (Candidatus Blackallbacteria) CG18_big_fil_WC_8_21_14_2_50_49_26]PIW18195.1 MAG: hypothetical protein COW36_05350 [bacterium (Candidatus Blackallbacteria) CG17_big_fil_post_rev_8_21_14_2_50_48_46]PIW50626.1 MAG: hypothetical protein COW20_01615 [bacterium (Candidatus Blackallbacteria) CG13_big_fil_rev_8_21_14_2_50_49_14]